MRLLSICAFASTDREVENRRMRAYVLILSILNAVEAFRAGQHLTETAPLIERGVEFLETAQSFCRGAYAVTRDGVTSGEAFALIMAAIPNGFDPIRVEPYIAALVALLESAENGLSPNLEPVSKLFQRMGAVLLADGAQEPAPVGAWRV